MKGGKIIGCLVVFCVMLGGVAALLLGGLAFFGFGDPVDDRRPILREARGALELGGDAVELLKALGGTGCTAKEGAEGAEGAAETGRERWVFRIRPDKVADAAPGCPANPGDLVVWVEKRLIVAFEPVHGESEVVRDAKAFQLFQRRYGRDPVADPSREIRMPEMGE